SPRSSAAQPVAPSTQSGGNPADAWVEGATGWAAEERGDERVPVAIGARAGYLFRPTRVFNL
ncbi:MAG: hypothetical protein AAFY66_12880, partial [Pseudomonadota bacterium]